MNVERGPGAPQTTRAPDADAVDGIRVLLVCDVRLFRDGLVRALSDTSKIRVVAATASRAEAEDALLRLKPDVMLLDMSVAHCIDIGRSVHSLAPNVGMVAFAAASTEAEQLACVEAGITGFVPREAGLKELVGAIVSVVRGETFCSPQVVASTFRRLADLAATARLADAGTKEVSARERQVIELIDRGLSNKEIAQRLSIGTATVKNHVHNILEKLQVARRGEVGARVRESTRAIPSLPSASADPSHEATTR